jgi:membrane-bound metal-dependent hydrolase YbcI (DUF457 family)
VPVPQYRTSYTVTRRSRAGEHEGDMEGSTHAVTGVLAGAGIGLLELWAGGGHPHGLAAAAGAGRCLLYGALAGGFALLPDSDHPKASFAYSLGAVSHGISHLVAVLSGGHRQGMHSLAGIGLMALVTQVLAVWVDTRWSLGALAFLMALCVTAGLTATGFARHGLDAVLLGCALSGLAVVTVRADLWWLVALGMALHIAEDLFTGHGTALAWPASRRRFGGNMKQPAPKRAPSGRAPRAGSPGRSRRPVTPGSPGRPVRRARGPVSMCLACLTDDCEACKGRGCGCPQPATSHPGRKPGAGPRPVAAGDLDAMPPVDPASDTPPF